MYTNIFINIYTNIWILIYFFIYFSYARFIFKILLNLIFIFLSSDNYKNKKTADCWSWGWSIWRGGLKLYWHFETSRLVVNHRFWIFIWGFGVGSEAHIPHSQDSEMLFTFFFYNYITIGLFAYNNNGRVRSETGKSFREISLLSVSRKNAKFSRNK